MADPERRTRIVITVTHDDRDEPPVTPGSSSGLLLGGWLAGAEVVVDDVGPALDSGERERTPFRQALEEYIGRRLDRLEQIKPDLGRRPTQNFIEESGRLQGLTDAYRLLTGAPARQAHNVATRARRAAWALEDGRRMA